MGGPLFIMLNGAGGFRKAAVHVQDLRFCGLTYQSLLQPVQISDKQFAVLSFDTSFFYGK